MQRQQRHVEIGTAARELSGPLGIGFGRHDGGRKDAGEAGRQGFGRHHRRLHQLLALRRPDARTAIVVELAAGDRVGLDAAARGADHPHAVLGAEVLDVGHGRMIAGRLGGRRARHHAIRHRMPGDDLGAAQRREAPILPVGIVVADQQRDAADRRLEHLDTGRARREDLLVLRVQPVLAVLADDAVGPQQHRGVVGEAGRGIPLGNADTHVHAGALEDGQQRRRGLAGNGIEKGRELLRPAEQIAADRGLGEYRVIDVLPAHLLGRLDEPRDIAIEIAPGRHEIDRRHLDRLLPHRRLCRGPGRERQPAGDTRQDGESPRFPIHVRFPLKVLATYCTSDAASSAAVG